MSESKKIKVVIADDHKIMTDGLTSLLIDQSHIKITGKASNGKKAFELIRKEPPDVLLTDINMPEMNGIELTRKVKSEFPEVNILALTMYEDATMITDMLNEGALGYLLKNTGKEELVKAVEKTAKGEAYFSDEIGNILLKNISSQKKPAENEVVNLTPRELEIVQLIAKENSNQEIAAQLYISERTVETDRNNIIGKTKTKGVVGLIKYAYKHQLINE